MRKRKINPDWLLTRSEILRIRAIEKKMDAIFDEKTGKMDREKYYPLGEKIDKIVQPKFDRAIERGVDAMKQLYKQMPGCFYRSELGTMINGIVGGPPYWTSTEEARFLK